MQPVRSRSTGRAAAPQHTRCIWLFLAAAVFGGLRCAAAQQAPMQCPAGEFGVAGSSQPCTKCDSSQARCLGGALVLPAPGWWQPSPKAASMSRYEHYRIACEAQRYFLVLQQQHARNATLAAGLRGNPPAAATSYTSICCCQPCLSTHAHALNPAQVSQSTCLPRISCSSMCCSRPPPACAAAVPPLLQHLNAILCGGRHLLQQQLQHCNISRQAMRRGACAASSIARGCHLCITSTAYRAAQPFQVCTAAMRA